MNDLSHEMLETTALEYESRFVPALFHGWAQQLVDAAAPRTGEAVLDVGCGTGVVARLAASRAGSGGRVAGVDANPGMLAVASRLVPQIDWRLGRAESLPFGDAAFDVVFCQFALMFFDDREAALRGMWRTLRPGGRLVVSVFDTLARNTAYAAMAEALQRHVGEVAAAALRMPFSLGDQGGLRALCAAADIHSAEVAAMQGQAGFASVRDMALADIRGWFPLAGISVDDPTIEALVTDVTPALGRFVDTHGRVEFPVSAHFVTAVKA
jgi:ubiquinone/menaquinone biosynthesis C-methylase UbiE